jgi:hypothetical protein
VARVTDIDYPWEPHLAAAEDYMFTAKLTGEPIGARWDAMGWDASDD